jgi:competence protein ComEC
LFVGSLLALEFLAVRAGRPQGQLRVTVLDVGQGDGILIDFPDGRAMLVDAGGIVGSPVDPGKRVILPLLRERRRKQIDVVVLSHPHPDHYGGLFSLAGQVEIREFWDSGLVRALYPQGRVAGFFDQLLRAGVVFKNAAQLCGRSQAFGAATVELLGPCPHFDRALSINDNSMVLKISYGKRAVLLTGDAERAQEQAILGHHPGKLRADLLKLGHHGSRTSSSAALLKTVQPSLFVISSGVRNRFGHPHPQTLQVVQRAKQPLWRTDRRGALLWATDGQRVWWSGK